MQPWETISKVPYKVIRLEKWPTEATRWLTSRKPWYLNHTMVWQWLVGREHVNRRRLQKGPVSFYIAMYHVLGNILELYVIKDVDPQSQNIFYDGIFQGHVFN